MRPLALSLSLLVAACGGTPPTEAPPTAPSADATTEAQGRRVEVAIAAEGYTPSEVQATPGEAVTLVFLRNDGANCGGEVVFPDTGERHTIPVGEPVEVAVTAPPSGKLAFTCGMGMYEGALVVGG